MKHKLKTSLALGLIVSSIMPIGSYALPNLDGLSNEEKVQVLSNNISDTIVKLEDKEAKLKENELALAEKSKMLIDTQKQYQAKKDVVNNTSSLNMRTSQGGELKILEMLLNSDSISEFLQNLEISKLMLKQNNKTLNTLTEKESQLEQLKEEIITEKETLEKEKLSLEEEKAKLDELKKEVEEAIKREEAERERQRQLAQQNNSFTSNYTIPDINVPVSGSASTLINYAKNFIGVPYVWGGSSPSGFDCSGLTSYVYRNAVGINLPRTASSQQNVGKRVALSDLQAGDLIFFGSPAHHVGIYIGNGQYLHAPKPGDRVKIANVPWNRLSTASRVL